jgi:hypothetical protein
MQPQDNQITGTVIRTKIAPGSKSDHVGVVLRTGEGDEYVLRRVGGNAFRDPALERLVGSTITGIGLVSGRNFIMKDWTVKKDD